ncbi:MAG: SusC/RagA family TonB-linked outer membrane protein [Saprospiraceae bacterium]|nr:SusC/RagA family TonB-linked outer membrane protein [Saprospiraceae bacterium]
MMKFVLPQGRNQAHFAPNSVLAKTFLLFCFLTFSVGFVQAQRMVSGVVVSDGDDQPIPGVSVVVKGTTTGGVTDLDGKFAVKVPDDNAILVFSGVGFTTQEVTVGSQTTVDIKLKDDTKTLGEVVVIGYGTQKKKDLTGSVASLNEKDFQKGNVATPEQLVAGKLAGVSVTSNGGAPGSGSRIRIRGASSLNASNDPLIVIDNVPLETLPGDGIKGAANPLSLINPNDIENITVLKDASATAIYGSRATNGVILVTTKKGAKGQKVGFNFSSVLSSAQVAKTLDVLSADELRDVVNRLGNSDQKKALGTASTDWQSLIYGSAFSHDNNLSASGAVGGLPFRASLGYLDQNGILLGSNMKRTTASLSLSPSLLDDHLRLNVNYKGAFINNSFAEQGTIGGAASFDPTQEVRGKDAKFGGYFEFVDASGNINTLAPKNPLAILENRKDKSNANRHIANAQLDYKFHGLPELRANVNVAIDLSDSEGTVLFDSTYGAAKIGKGVNNFLYSK